MRKNKGRKKLFLTLQGEEGNQDQVPEADGEILLDPYALNPLLFPTTSLWRWYPVRLTNFTIPPGQKAVVWNMKSSGWIHFVTVRCNNPDIIFQIDVQADGLLEIAVSIRDLKDMGLVSPMAGVFTVTNYDDSNNDYTFVYSPTGWGIPFRGMNRGTIYNPTTETVTVKLLNAWILELL